MSTTIPDNWLCPKIAAGILRCSLRSAQRYATAGKFGGFCLRGRRFFDRDKLHEHVPAQAIELKTPKATAATNATASKRPRK